MKLYEVNQAIEGIFELLVDPETGELLPDECLLEQLSALQLEKSRILEYLAKLVLNTKAPSLPLRDFLIKENRFATLARTQPTIAERLFEEAQNEAMKRYEFYEKLSKEI